MVINNFKFMYRWGFRGFTLGKLQVFYDDPSERDPVIQNHEDIHLAQFEELGFWETLRQYYSEYFMLKKKYGDKETAYRLVSFEQEAYKNAENLDYLKTREAFAWKKYIVPKIGL